MKEATGELSMTAIVVVIIGVIAVAAPPIVRSVINSTARSTNCKSAFGCEKNGTAYKCSYIDESGTKKDDLICTADQLGIEETTE